MLLVDLLANYLYLLRYIVVVLMLLLLVFALDESIRGQGIGSDLLTEAEQIAKARGCSFVILDTLDFQARPFYERHGYQVQWTQANYPLTGCKYFMTKSL